MKQRNLHELSMLCPKITLRALNYKTTWDRHNRLIALIDSRIKEITDKQTVLNLN